ncbi:elongation of very long chain fatty acids protein-like [Homarus americanus]|nr:elongation of very long chain fatty acids protein-like [Homarus americanus]
MTPKPLTEKTSPRDLNSCQGNLTPLIMNQKHDPDNEPDSRRRQDHYIDHKVHHSDHKHQDKDLKPLKDHNSTPSEDADNENKLWSNGCGAALAILFLYLYGNVLVMDQMPVDPRVQSWYFVTSPTPILLISLAYIAGVTWAGPRLMRHRQPIKNLKSVMIIYNAFQVIFSTYLFYEAGMAGWFGSYSFLCQPCDFSDSPSAVRMLHTAYWYNFSKFVDFLDTVFFVLNKKYSHISLLHVSHHALMPLGVWYGVRHEPGGQTTFFGFLNTFVHIVMYLYYLLAALGPRVRPFLWWKKYLTSLQMVQFVAMFLHAALTIVTGCPVGIQLMKLVFGLAVIFLILFTDFYIKAYRDKMRGTITCVPKLSSIYNQEQNGQINGKAVDAVYKKSFSHKFE